MNLTGLQRPRSAIVIWLLMLIVCAVIISRSHFTADLSAFLPSNPTAEQQLLLDQLKDGVASRLILVGIEGSDANTRAKLSKEVAQGLRNNDEFVTVNNGEPISSERDRLYLFNNRYLLSPAVTPAHFSVDGLHSAISDSIDQIASPAGLLLKSLLPHDPTGEMLQLLDQMNAESRPQLFDGAWASHDGKTSLLLLQTRAVGSDTDAQKLAMQTIQAAFDQASLSVISQKYIVTENKPKLLMTGPGVFSVVSRDAIKSQVRLIFIVSTVLIALLLLYVYRSLTALLLGFLPVATGILAGIASVSLGFGVVHGITLGFGTALIGEAVDYSIYLFIQSDYAADGKSEKNRQQWIANVWPTVRLGVLTSVFGFAALMLSGFPGLAQLGLYSTAGLIAAATMTRYVLPHLLPAGFKIQNLNNAGLKLSYYAHLASRLKWPAIGLIVASSLVVYQHHDHLWNSELTALSPVSSADLALDTRLRAGMGAPDVRYLVVVSGNSQEAVLMSSEKVSIALQPLVESGELTAFDSASHYLPSQHTQQARLDSLPNAEELRPNLENAIKDLPVRAKVFTPFVQDVEASRTKPLLQRSDLDGTSMAMAVDAMLLQQGKRWSALIPLTAPKSGNIDATQMRKAITQAQVSNALFVDMKTESNRLYSSYMHEAIMLSLAGLTAIVMLLLFALRSPVRVLAIIAPLIASVLTVTAGLALLGQQLIILHLIGLLLIVAIGSNYALFFNPPLNQHTQAISSHTYASLLLANVATVLGFGLLAFSNVPVLQAMGITVAPGVILALIFSAVFARHAPPDKAKI
ncbi:MAG: MMPL family transporter [Methylotenera sp.]|uniref:MMPL family transporter n=1 Tax=Methylotenera sp. TaxID=2051956 RepID=UPI0024883398|nr:MMPL family transporter [Methylotenera sp.]MDI1308692.1 MMPL family transporter [Methylotenera sp.]